MRLKRIRSRRACDRVEKWLTRDSSGDGHVALDEQPVNIKNVILTSIANCIHIITIHRSGPKWTVGSDGASCVHLEYSINLYVTFAVSSVTTTAVDVFCEHLLLYFYHSTASVILHDIPSF